MIDTNEGVHRNSNENKIKIRKWATDVDELDKAKLTSNISYVENYLLQNRDLPSKVRKTVSEIMQNFDPFDNEKELFTESGKKHYGDIVKEIFSEDDDEIPF